MKKATFIVLFTALSMGSIAASAVEVGLGTLKIGGVLQAVYGYAPGGLGYRTWSFTEKRARVILNGDLPEQKVRYLIQLETLSPSPLLDARIQACSWLPNIDIYAGRFLPTFGFYMPRSTASLEMINYPLLVTTYAPWRQVGAQASYRVGTSEANIGLFNGYPANNTTDNDPGKDMMLSFYFRPLGNVVLYGFGWLGNVILSRDQDTRRNWFGGGIISERKLGDKMMLILRSEGAFGEEDNPGPLIKKGGFYLHAGFRPHPKIELLGRLDRFDTKGDDDGTAWFTGGVNYYFSGTNLMLYANYVHKRLETDPAGNDDEFLLQVQLAF